MTKLDKLIDYMNKYHFKDLNEMVKNDHHRQAIENILNEPLSFAEKNDMLYK